MSQINKGHHVKETKTELPSRVAQWYYKHGLFLSSYPTCASSLAIFMVLSSCYPLLNIPLPGTIPTKIILPYEHQTTTIKSPTILTNSDEVPSGSGNASHEQPPFPWANSDPFVYIQQIMLRSSVLPWRKNLLLTDAYRGPLHEIFKLLEIVRNHEEETSKTNLANICLHVENVKKPTKYSSIFPEYNCLILSPANLWQQNAQNFKKDTNLLSTIFHHHNLQKSKVSTAEMLFGMLLRDSGVKRYPIRVRPRIIQYAITLVLEKNDPVFIESLKQKLIQAYPLHQENVATMTATKPAHREAITYIYYPGEFNVIECVPMCIAFLLVFMYVYFSMRKIDVFKSRFVLAISAVVTVLSSLMMALGLCFFFGLTISMQSRGVLPYLIMLFGLENVLVITKSVVSTDEKFDVKIRVAQGLSKEGWSITKTLLTEITILTIGLVTFVPVIQEFSIFAIVGLISDFFMQMLLFSTVLALNIRRIEFSNLAKSSNVPDMAQRVPYRYVGSTPKAQSTSMSRSRSHPKFSVAADSMQPTDVVAAGKAIAETKKIPKRLKIINFWARTRFFQRAFMLWMIVWICSIVYNSDIFAHIFVMEAKNHTDLPDDNGFENYAPHGMQMSNMDIKHGDSVSFVEKEGDSQHKSTYFDEKQYNLTEQLNKLRHPDYDVNLHLSNFHWSSVLKQYNISVSGKYVTILPTIRISHVVTPDEAIYLRNVDEKPKLHFQWKALAIALDPIDFADMEEKEGSIAYHLTNAGGYNIGSTPLYPKTPMEMLLATILCTISIVVVSYAMIVFYRCICSRNYAEWRSSWNDSKTDIAYPKTQRIFESIPIQIKGHSHRIECMVTDGRMLACSCLDGKITTWDVSNGEQISVINRKNYFNINRRLSGSYTPSAGGNDGSSPITMTATPTVASNKKPEVSPIWCLDYTDNLIVIGCADGKIEFWESTTGTLKCIYEGEGKQNYGITHLHLSGDRLVAARLNGRIDFLRLETYNQGRQIDWGFMSAYRRTHVRTGSTGSLSNSQLASQGNDICSIASSSQEEMRCFLEQQHQGHQQLITCMNVVGNTVLTGSQDHTLKVFKLDLANLVFTLHGHYGPITSIFIDHYQSCTGGSGSQDGLLCVWDLITGACMYSIQAHDGAIVSLICSSSYVISIGTDERLYIWERFQGNLLNTINVPYVYTSLLMLTPSLLITAKPGALVIWDVRRGEQTREIKLDCLNSHLCSKKILFASGSVVCDYGNEMRIIRFPIVNDKCD